MAKVLVTGGAGYIGSHTVHAFLDGGHSVAVVDNLSTGTRSAVPEGVPFHEADVGDAAAMDSILSDFQPDGVLHFAGSLIVPDSLTCPENYYRNNTVATLTLAEACLRRGVKRLVYSSSAAVYGLFEGAAADETSPTAPMTPYGWSKLMAERILADLSRAHGLRYAALRYFNVAGADPKGRVGLGKNRAPHLLKVACDVALGRRPALPLYGTDYETRDGTCIRDFVHVSDLAFAHVLAFAYLEHSENPLILNCGVGRGYSVREVIAAMDHILDHPLRVEEHPRRPGDPPALVAATDRIRATLGWIPRFHRLEDIIRTTLACERGQEAENAENKEGSR
ncbi:MAG: UDP-glucose 4-epimerase GalE [Rhodospirillum sp.]|nr:UDP-glucose 4-epimerase GalE [Rhodospirillum sp.]MCF8487637.1 UDP-glucose 4-epimerase GalE [Rhodospirillum sp.]MCF8499241.1 UDP-glucose 4-epimerase GalE [Rhodospirillum sp.]